MLLVSIDRVVLRRNLSTSYLQHNDYNTMINAFLNILAPENCIECGQEGAIWCEGCRLSDPLLPSRCFLCHAVTANFDVCSKCKKKTAVRRMYVAKEYKDSAKSIIYALKFHPKRHASDPIGATIADMLPFYEPNSSIIVNVPSSPQRVRQRGFDHTVFIAKTVARHKGIPYKNALVRVGNQRQVGSRRQDRIKQAELAYRIRSQKSVYGRHIILIDDVVTTGATASAICRILLAAGAKSVDCAVFAYSK